MTMPNMPAAAPLVTAAELADYVHSDATDAHLERSIATASELVRRHVGTAAVPESILAQAALEVAANLWQRRQAATGLPAFGSAEVIGNGMRPALNPITPALPILAPYLRPPLA